MVLTLAGVAACDKQPVRLPTAQVVLMETPPPPARLFIPVDLPEPEPPAPETPEPPAPTPAPARPSPAAPPRPVERPAATTPAEAAPAPVLRTTVDTAAAERRIAQLIEEAEQHLGKLNYRDLNPGARTQYDAVRSSIRMARDAVKVKNYTYADFLAARAASLAGQLVKG